MLSEIDREIANELKERLQSLIPLINFLVYGSRARGDSSFDADMDIFIEVESISKEQRNKVYEIASEIGFELNRVISTFVATSDQIARGPLAANPILDKIATEGVPV